VTAPIDGKALLARLRALPPGERQAALDAAGEAAVIAFDEDWPVWAHEGQLPPNDDWDIWTALCGRGFGKTRAGAEWVSEMARTTPDAKIALVAATPKEARRVMIEGRSGLLTVARDGPERRDMRWEPTLGRLTFAGGAEAFVYSGANGEDLRGPEHHFAWCDELAKWKRADAALDNLMLGLRCGDRPRMIVTTTPKPVPTLRRVLSMPNVVLTGGASWHNPHLSDPFIDMVRKIHEGTRFGRQELLGELLEDFDGALWPRALIEKARMGTVTFTHGRAWISHGGGKSDCPPTPLARIVIGVDPPASAEGDACGIIACGLDETGTAWVLADHSAAGCSPEQWARKVDAAAGKWGADRIIAEGNQGGQMVESVLRGAGLRLPVKTVYARVGKSARAEPIAAFFETGEAKLAGHFPELEDQLAGMILGGAYQGPGRSPDRADAMVWALTELLLETPAAEPRIVML